MSSPLVLLASFTLLLATVPAAAGEEAPADPVGTALASPQATGLLVTVVVAGSQAARLGIGLGDVITSYAGRETPTVDALREAMAGATGAETRAVTVVRLDGSTKTFELEPGPIGVQLSAVEKGKGAPPLPPATDVAFDFSALEGRRQDDWYDFTMDGKHAGFEHALAWVEDGKVHVRREVAFDGGERWGVNHFDVTVVMTAAEQPKLVSVEFLNPITGYEGRGRPAVIDGRAVVRYTHNGGEAGPETTDHAVPADLPAIPSYFIETLACLMPREKGACFHYRPITDGFGDVGRPSALLAVGETELEIAGEQVKAFEYRIHTFGGARSNGYWVDADGRIVKADYMGAVTFRAPKERALKDLHHGIRPRTAD